MNSHAFAAFLATSLVLAVTPGPGVVYVVARTAAQGRKAGLVSVLGVAAGNFCNAVAASLGLAVLFAACAAAFTAVKLAGAAYLFYLGVRALRFSCPAPDTPAFDAPVLADVCREGFTVALLNPKTALFFAALLPQFLVPSGATAAQGIVLATVFVGIAFLTDTMYVLAASIARARVRGGFKAPRAGRYATAATFLGLGVYAALSGSRSGR